MKILIDIGHPAHVHLFKNLANELITKKHQVLFTCREKEFEIYLLEKLNLNHISFGKKYSSILGKIWGLIDFGVKEFVSGLKFKPDIFLSHGSPYATHAAYLLGKPHISLEDTFNKEQVRLYKPFTNVILTGDYDHPLNSKKIIRYSGYHELAYLHPNWFRPDEAILSELGVKKNEKYVILRFVSWKASHDIGHTGLFYENKLKAVNAFKKYSKVYISSEAMLPDELKPYQINIAPEKIHHALAFASFVFGESFTMLAEASVLGTPSILVHNTKCYYLNELEKVYGLSHIFSESHVDQLNAIKKGVEILKGNEQNFLKQKRLNHLLAEKIDVTAFLIWFVENYPASFETMKENPDYQLNFK